MKTPTLETERLILRPITLDDAPSIQKHFNDWEIIKNLSKSVPWPYPDDGAEVFIRDNALPRVRDKGHMVWCITMKPKGGEAIGMIDFGRTKSVHGDRGFWLSKNFQRQGIMTEAITCINDFLFFELGLDKFIVCNAFSNIDSKGVKKKTGAKFLRFGELEHHNGEVKTEVWEVTRENWARIRGREID